MEITKMFCFSKYEAQAICISAVVVLVGLISGFTISANSFARSGSLLVIIGILFGLLDLPRKLSQITSILESAKEKSRGTLISEGKDPDKVDEALAQAAREAHQEITPIIKKRKKRFAQVEGTIVIAGTLIWGFGDLLIIAFKCHS